MAAIRPACPRVRLRPHSPTRGCGPGSRGHVHDIRWRGNRGHASAPFGERRRSTAPSPALDRQARLVLHLATDLGHLALGFRQQCIGRVARIGQDPGGLAAGLDAPRLRALSLGERRLPFLARDRERLDPFRIPLAGWRPGSPPATRGSPTRARGPGPAPRGPAPAARQSRTPATRPAARSRGGRSGAASPRRTRPRRWSAPAASLAKALSSA